MEINKTYIYELSITTQGPLYPPSEVIDKNGDFVVIGTLPQEGERNWGMAIVDKKTPVPTFGYVEPYLIKKDLSNASIKELSDIELFTLPLPLPSNNYPMVFAPEQCPNAGEVVRDSCSLNQAYISDYRESDGRRKINKITLADWVKAEGTLTVTVADNSRSARFDFVFSHLIPNSLYTVMSLRENDLNPAMLSRPGPLGIPNVFVTDEHGSASYWAILDNPFPSNVDEDANRIINVVVLFMSSQQSYGGAIGLYGLGGDIHAHLKLKKSDFHDITTLG
ncbi:hypothetical protein Z042_15710 [Chania multitudinisentens RB-25]|uniref:Uncharacterized protein n=1 Tax=Chania multitudinisentens RB-25 TaxID=1441930 RepID=W0LB09_9GAMM|nr:hypothetical protein [Chania multitudinisentens]AHG20886.2 hypothetical protein Z042_15710 [Chania multitudinisentens RB-25]